jgi:SAM-dependent methyltransferase
MNAVQTAAARPDDGPSRPEDLDQAVEEQMGKLVSELGAALGVLLTSLGTRSGLWAALAGAGPLTAAEVAALVSVDPALVREWLRAQAAGGYLDYDPAGGTFLLSDAAAAALCYGPGGALVDACATMLSSMGEAYAAFSEAFSSGRGFGWHQRTEEYWHGLDEFTRLMLPAGLIGAAVAAAAGVPEALAAGGSVVDIGCGYGAPTLSMARLFPAASVLGVDYHDASVAHARAEAARNGPRNVRFEVAAAADLPGRSYDLVTFFDSLHDMGDPLGALERARHALAPSGTVLLFEPLGADDVQGNFHPNGRMFYAVSTLVCTPNAVSQRTAASPEPLGAQAGEKLLRRLAADAGFGRVRRLDVPAPLNLVLELRP